jgi:hypothetical protein
VKLSGFPLAFLSGKFGEFWSSWENTLKVFLDIDEKMLSRYFFGSANSQSLKLSKNTKITRGKHSKSHTI